MPKVIVAKTAGFCGGVRKAVEIAFDSAKKIKPLYIMGELVHNPIVNHELESLGVVRNDDMETLHEGDTLLLRAHGVTEKTYTDLRDKNIDYIDTTCVFVKKVHSIVADIDENANVLLAGDSTHPEVIGIIGHCKNKVVCFKTVEELEKIIENDDKYIKNPTVLVAQTTFNVEEWKKSEKLLKKLCTNAIIFDTICKATVVRQQEALDLSSKCDLMIVIGGKNSSNTQKLFKICQQSCRTYLVENIDDISNIDTCSINDQTIIGITAGASTPDCIIKEVQKSMSNLDNITNEMSFEEMLNESFKSVHNGERVTATVIKVKDNEILVDCGVKYACYVPLNELTDDPSLKPSDIVKTGDEVELIAVRVNDVEGTIMLSKKRLDAVAGFERVMNAAETGEILTGRVIEVIKGGVLVLTNGVKIFVPASQTGVARNGDLNSIVNTEVTFKILETNRQRHRAIGSIAVLKREERREQAEKVWADIAVGKEYTGKVKSITNFGVFVDIGGVDGRIALPDLTWLRVKHPSEVVSVGDEITVTVKDINEADKKISLSYKKDKENPWEKIRTMYNVGDTVSTKVISLTAFGAFAEIIPGVDGLIHISQISKEHVEKVSDKLHVGDVVEAKITELDFDKKRASLSIKALLEDAEESVEEKTEEVAE